MFFRKLCHECLGGLLYRLCVFVGIADQKRAITPVLFTHPAGIRTVIAESDVRDYPGMYLTKNKGHFQGTFAAYPDSVAMGSWCNFVAVVQTRQNYIARTSGKREFPWRIIMATDDDKTLLNNELVYKLATLSVLPIPTG